MSIVNPKFDYLLQIVHHLNRFHVKESSKVKCLPFIIDEKLVGLIRSDIWEHLQHYSSLLIKNRWRGKEAVFLNPELKTLEERSKAIAPVLEELRSKNVLRSLRGWRNELYDVFAELSGPSLMRMERSATCLFGVIQCGVHVNGYTHHPDLGPAMWIAKRSRTKPTWPGRLDQMSAGGVTAGLTKMEIARKECQEEASVPDHLLDKLRPVGTISFTYEDERGIFPEVEYIMDILLPHDFTPVNQDGEAESFHLVPISSLKERLLVDNFKPNCALCIIDFLVRHGHINPDNEPHYHEIVAGMHCSLKLLDDC